MSDTPTPKTPAKHGAKQPRTGSSAGQGREDRLKAALKANMARRKAQTKARQADPDDNSGGA